MSRRWLLSLLCLSLGALFLVQPTRARYDLRVDEAKTKLSVSNGQYRFAVASGEPPFTIKLYYLETHPTLPRIGTDRCDPADEKESKAQMAKHKMQSAKIKAQKSKTR